MEHKKTEIIMEAHRLYKSLIYKGYRRWQALAIARTFKRAKMAILLLSV